jgi:hypothetical protein
MDKLIGLVIVGVIGLVLIASGALMLAKNVDVGIGLIAVGVLEIGFGFRLIP